jgi:transcriptional regulator with XRE-family HTH domain
MEDWYMTQKREFANIASLVKSYRTPKGISQTQLSKELGYKNGQFISNVERGLCSIPFEKIPTLSKILDVPADKVKEAILSDYSTNIDRFIETVRGGMVSASTSTTVGSLNAKTAHGE